MNAIKHDLTTKLLTALPELELNSSDFVLKIHQEILKGKPLSILRYYQLINLETAKADLILDKFGVLNEEGGIIAFFGLSLVPTKHKLIVEDRTFYTWCVVDGILFTDWLGIDSTIESNDPVDGSLIRVEISSDKLVSSSPSPLYVSWVDNIDDCNLRDSLCDHVSLFASKTTADQWSESQPKGRVITLTDFFEKDTSDLNCC